MEMLNSLSDEPMIGFSYMAGFNFNKKEVLIPIGKLYDLPGYKKTA
ncbi:MAG: hypothetical protein ABIN48_01430 [Ginsengibacter sp.]